ncbi:hypothetical protein [Sphingomonas hankookensis]
MTTPKTTDARKFYATKDFTDAGTERSFEYGKEVDVDEGTALNYEAAGLVSTQKPAAEKATA